MRKTLVVFACAALSAAIVAWPGGANAAQVKGNTGQMATINTVQITGNNSDIGAMTAYRISADTMAMIARDTGQSLEMNATALEGMTHRHHYYTASDQATNLGPANQLMPWEVASNAEIVAGLANTNNFAYYQTNQASSNRPRYLEEMPASKANLA